MCFFPACLAGQDGGISEKSVPFFSTEKMGWERLALDKDESIV